MAELAWWQSGIIYQIYPRSFQDGNGDGIGDLQGITRRLDHLICLGVDAVWLSPFYQSPMADFGYDIADYCNVDPIFGSLADFDRLREETRQRGLKLILDLVPNHTSDRHPWFEESRASRHNAKRDWYIWRDPAADGGPPNNWRSNFGGSAWEFDEATGQYYYHAFLKEQPDLNWRNPAVREAIYDVMRFWLDRGADGFRVDVIWHLMKDAEFRDNPPNPGFQPGDPEIRRYLEVYSADQPEIHDVIAEMRHVLDGYAERVLIGEIYLPLERLVAYYGADLKGAHLPFNFQLVESPWNARTLARIVEEYERALPAGGWPNWVLGNHDRPRIASRVGQPQARVAAMKLLTLRGTPTLYYGDEIGLEDAEIPPDLVQDPAEKNEPGLGLGRDPQRTPMQWDRSDNAGFTTGKPWLPLSPDWRERNVATLAEDERSLLTLYRRLIALRKATPVLVAGSYVPIEMTKDLFAFERVSEDGRVVVALNLGPEPETVDFGERLAQGRILLSTHLDREGESVTGRLALRADEGVIIAVG
ncbi:alpha-amylase family glycosyl hydrolase [Chelatococcus sp. GCM10030263]|uniref:alpha-amylase family glycosyl hydrolase n=1 Tax=Chelatococcus sp. GCM10030263 TaxID=3273387 RepID=UPI00360AF2C2